MAASENFVFSPSNSPRDRQLKEGNTGVKIMGGKVECHLSIICLCRSIPEIRRKGLSSWGKNERIGTISWVADSPCKKRSCCYSYREETGKGIYQRKKKWTRILLNGHVFNLETFASKEPRKRKAL